MFTSLAHRDFGYLWMGNLAAQLSIGLTPVGYIAEHFGIDTALWISAICLAIVTLMPGLFIPAIRKEDRGYSGE